MGNITYNARTVLEIDDETVIGFDRDSEGYDRMSIKIRDSKGKVILKMERNDWVVYPTHLFDLVCPAQGKELVIISKDKKTEFKVRFNEYPLNKFKKFLYSMSIESNIEWFISQIGSPARISVWIMTGKLAWGNYNIIVGSDAIVINGKSFVGGNFFTGSLAALKIINGRLALG